MKDDSILRGKGYGGHLMRGRRERGGILNDIQSFEGFIYYLQVDLVVDLNRTDTSERVGPCWIGSVIK